MATTATEPAPALLVDRARRRVDYLRVSVTDRCNYRCTYCRPEVGGATHATRADVLDATELVRLVGVFVRLGVKRVRLTGGEPTMRGDLVDIVRKLRALTGIEELSLSTNGHRLAELAWPLRAAGVDRLNVSVDTLDPLRFAGITRGGDLSRVLDGLEAARSAGFARIKLNTVAVRGFNEDELAGICRFAWDRGMVPRFIEQMPMAGGALFVPGELMTAEEIRRAVLADHPGATFSRDVPEIAGAGPARYFRVVLSKHEPVGTFGVISPMTEHFCDTCNRVRLSSTGQLHTCLGHDDMTDLRGALAAGGDGQVEVAIRAALSLKRDGHQFGLIGIGGPRKSMVQIGG